MCLLILKNNPIRFTSPLALSASSNFSSLLKIPIFSSPSSLLNSALSSSLRKWKQQVPTITSAHLVTLMLLIFPFPPTVVAEGTAILSEPWQNSRTLRIRRETRFHRGLWESRHQYPGDKVRTVNTAFQAAAFPWLLSSLFQLVSKPGWRQLPPGQVTIRTPAKRPKE